VARSRPAPEVTARIRAARAYANLTQKDLARAIGVSEQTQKRSEGAEPARVPDDDELRAIARACELPFDFFTMDFGAPEATLAERVAALEREVSEVSAVLSGEGGRLMPRFRQVLVDVAREQQPPRQQRPQAPRAKTTRSAGGSPGRAGS
jgi:transcriptional regulator with XRE-family HTH domain